MFIAIMRKEFILWKRYFANSLGELITFYLVFLLIFAGYKGFGGQGASTGSLEHIVVGYMLWMFAIFTYGDISWNISREASEGTLEQLYMSPYGFARITLYRLGALFLINLGINACFLFIVMSTTGRYLNLDLASVLPVLVISLVGVVGIGLMLGGLTLVFKRVQSYLQIVQFVFVFLIAIPISQYPWAKLLPLTLGNHLLQKIMVGGVDLGALFGTDVTFLVLNSALYFALGLLVFKLCERRAMDRGLLGHY